jgi:hypothetical protein
MNRRRIPIELLDERHHVTSVFSVLGDVRRFAEALTDDRKPADLAAIAAPDDWEVIEDAIWRHVTYEGSGVMNLAHRDVLNDRQFRALYDRLSGLPQKIVEAAQSLGAEHGLESPREAMLHTVAVVPLATAQRLCQLIVEQRVVLLVPQETRLG